MVEIVVKARRTRWKLVNVRGKGTSWVWEPMETCQDTELVERFGVLPLLQLIFFTVNDLTGTHHSLDTRVTLIPEVEIVVKADGVETCEGVHGKIG